MTEKLNSRENSVFRGLCKVINAMHSEDISATKIAQAIGVWGGLEEK